MSKGGRRGSGHGTQGEPVTGSPQGLRGMANHDRLLVRPHETPAAKPAAQSTLESEEDREKELEGYVDRGPRSVV